MRSHRVRSVNRSRRIGLALVVAAVLLVQMLGLVHRVAHGVPGFDSAALAAHGHATDTLFADHDDGAKCRLYDQLTHADLDVGVVATIEILPTLDVTLQLHPAWQIAAQAAGYLARGPPALG
jgi:hypothetical protein